MSEDIIQIKDLVRIFRRNLLASFLIVAACTAAAVVAAFVVPKRYKASAVLNIPAAYFQIPLVSDLIASVHDPSEARAQRESLLRLSLSDEFVDSLAEKYGAYASAPGEPLRTVERETFKKGLQYFSISPTSFQISASGATPDEAYGKTKSVLDRMVSTLISERLSKLTRTKNAIESNLNSLRVGLSSGGAADSGTVTMLREEVKKAEDDLAMLEARFTPQHPTVAEQRRRAEALRERLGTLTRGGRVAEGGGAMAAGSKKALQDMYDELARKFNYLNVVLDMEKESENVSYLSVIEQPAVPATPYFPKKRMFVIVGFGAGLVLAIILALFRELKRGTFMTPVRAAQSLDVPFLGVMPSWQTADARTLIEGYTMASGPKQLTVSEAAETRPKGKKKKG